MKSPTSYDAADFDKIEQTCLLVIVVGVCVLWGIFFPHVPLYSLVGLYFFLGALGAAAIADFIIDIICPQKPEKSVLMIFFTVLNITSLFDYALLFVPLLTGLLFYEIGLHYFQLDREFCIAVGLAGIFGASSVMKHLGNLRSAFSQV